ncbi:MAG: peptide chain release factor N(5)-glutamine methyltransferase [Oscillospiraceae bacterium]|jgi:release factor glutamine methyltransferase
MATLQSAFQSVWHQFSDHGIAGAQLEARLLTAFVAGKTPEQFLRDRQMALSPTAEQQLQTLLERRLCGEPLAYLIGNWSFYGLPFVVCPDVLIPRMDTEVLIDCILHDLSEKLDSSWSILDLCSGSGCIGCALAVNLPNSRVTLADISTAALAVCETNVAQNGLSDRVSCRLADAKSVPPADWQPMDLIVCNPPYIPTSDLKTLDCTVRDYEPTLALDGGADGLDFYRAVLAHWAPLLTADGRLYFEVGINQTETVLALMPQYGIAPIGKVHDSLGVARVVIGKQVQSSNT